MNTSRRHRVPARPGLVRIVLMLLVAVATLAGSTGFTLARPATASAAAALPTRDPLHVRVTTDGIVPATINAIVGQAVVFDNETGAERTITATGGAFDSGPIPAEGAFAVTLSQPGNYAFTSPGDPELSGLLVVGLSGLPAASSAAKVGDVIPDMAPGPVTDLAPHPDYLLNTSRTRLIVLPSATATVGAFNELLDDNDLTIVGGMQNLKELVVATADPGDHSAVMQAAAALRGSNLVSATSLDFEVVEQNIPRPISAPTGDTDPPATWQWQDPNAAPPAGDATWGMRDINAPTAWNLLDTARAAGQPALVTAMELSAGVDHDDLEFSVYDACNFWCSDQGHANHAQHVMGVIGATYDNTGVDASHTKGIVGVNPLGRTILTVNRTAASDQYNTGLLSQAGLMYTLDKILGQTGAGQRFDGLKAINISLAASAWIPAPAERYKQWQTQYPYNEMTPATNVLCGPNAADDNDPGAATQPCYPGNLDAYRTDFAQLAQAMVPVIRLATDKKVILVKAASNDNHTFCIQRPVPGTGEWKLNPWTCTPGVDQFLDMNVHKMNEFAAARDLMGTTATSLLIVEAHNLARQPALFSQRQGDISAPGEQILSLYEHNKYGIMSGTSMASPFVTGAIGYLYSVKPGATWQQVIAAIKDGARTAPGGGTKQLDLFGAEVKLGLLKNALDINDPSADGSRRLIRDDHGMPIAEDLVSTATPDVWDAQFGSRTSAPDGKIDMRDFRRFRDAWLHTCEEQSAGTQAGSAPSCPPAIFLDGPTKHPKKDGNGDRCNTLSNSGCQAKDGWYSRFDANGDGRLSVYAQAPVAITATGQATTTASQLTDLDVFQRFFETNTANTEGWTKNDLPALLVSADIDLRLGDFWAAGANNVAVTTLVDGVATGPARTFAKPATGPGGGMITLPVDEWGSKVELVASATGPDGNPLTAVPFVVPVLLAGDDKVASPCVARLDLTFDTQALLPGQETDVRASVHDCNPASTRPEVENRIVTFGVLAEGDEVPVILGVPGSIVDSKGTAEATLRAGTGTGTFTVWAKLELPGGHVLRGEADVTVTPQIKLAYHWRASLDSFDVEGSTRWNGMPDCSSTGQDYCVDHAHQYVDPEDPTITFDRRGTITATTAGVRLTEEVGGGGGYVTTDFTWTDLATGVVHDDGIKLFGFNIIGSERNRYANHPVPVDMTPVDGEVLVSNLRSLALLGYRSNAWASGYGIDPPGVGMPGDFFLEPRPDGSSIAYAKDFDRVLRFMPDDPAGSDYEWCGTTVRDLTTPPSYYTGDISDWVVGASNMVADTQYDEGDKPLLAGPGEIRFDIEFAASISVGGEPADPALPFCGGSGNLPAAEFRVVNEAPIEEGEAVQFIDESVDLDGDIAEYAWDFGGAGASAAQDANFSQGFPDEGTYPVTLMVTDEDGNTASATHDVVVVNAKPTAEFVSSVAVGTANVPMSVHVLVDDPGKEDRRSLKVKLDSSNPAFPDAIVLNRPAGNVKFDLPGLKAGEYPLTVTVTDDGGASATATANLSVTAVPPTPVPQPPLPPVLVDAPGCTAPIPLDADEAELLGRINAQRALVHQPPLIMSSKLTAAAERQSIDMLVNGTISGTGSDGSTTRTRVNEAGYPAQADVEEFLSTAILIGDVWANLRQGVSATWFSQGMAMIGISRAADDTNVRWSVVVGTVVDCDEEPRGEGSAPVASLTAPDTVEEGITFSVQPTSSDADGDMTMQQISWGDGAVGGIRHRYQDDGTYTITVTARDLAGHVSTASTEIVVTASAPEVSITPRRLVAGTRGVIAINMIELAAADRPLSVVITSDNPVYIPPAPFTWDMGGYVYAVTPPAPGSFTLTVRVTDRDGVTGTATETFHVDAPPGTPAVAPDNVVLDPAPACATGMEVIGQAAEQLALINAYRARHGLGALAVVPELTAAAERHALDMQNHRFFAHEGSDGSSPASRIRDTGYPGAGGENIALRTTTPAEQMAGWIMSPPHHTNILNPTWKAIGIADVNGQDGVLAVNVFGDRVTCPTGDEIAPEPRVLANPDAGKPAGQLGDSGEGPVAPYPAPSQVAPAEVVAEAPAAGIAEQPEVTALAVTISDRTPTAGQLITIVNRSRDLGLPRSVAMSLPLTQPTLVAADATRRVIVLDPGVFTIGLSGSGYPGIPMAVSIELPVDGEARPPTVVLTQPGDAVSGELVELSATVYEPDGEPAPGRPVRFSIGNLTSTTASDNDGVATTTVRADLAAGEWPLRAEVLTDAGHVAAIAERTITIGTNLIPVADAGGPYLVTIGDELTLDASGTYDADGEFVSYFWDLDHDGAFDDAETAAPEVDYVTLQELLCAGLCETGVDYTLTLRVVDPKGGTSEDTATVTFVRDFVVVVSPATITITPGSSNSFVVDVVTTSGFTSPVALSAAGLPAGATAVFAPTSVAPGQRSTLTITLPADVGGLEAIDLSVTGTSGDIVRTASSTVDVVFGLPPRCTTVVSGTVLDAETGLPIAGALVRVDDANTQRIDVNTDGDGAWQVDNASPSTTNKPGPIARRVEAQGYWPADLSATATCGVPLQLVDRLTPVHYVTVRGQVRVGAPDPVNPIEMVPSAAVAPNTKVSLTAGGTKILDNVAVNTDGEFEATVPLAAGNSAQSISVSGEAPNYWKTTVNTSVKDNETKFVMVLLRGKCTGLITGGRVIDASNKAVPGATVTINGKSATAGSDGRYTIDAVVALATGGLPVSVSISGGAPANRTDLLGTSKSVTMSKCDDVMAVDVILPFKPTPPPSNTHYGSVSGVVTDVDTGLPVAGADVKVGTSSSVKTSADGRFLVPSVSLGSATAADIGMSITKTGYWQESATVRINEGATTDVAKTILSIRYGAVSGVVTDQVTGAPLSGAKVIAGNVTVYSDAEGRYTATGVSLGSRNTPRTITTTTTLDGYWKRDISVQVSQDTTVSNNVALLKECATASISGIVVNAETRQPINGAKVQARDVGTVTTGADGRFTFPSVKMLTGNVPWGVELTASATGFVSQKKTVNVFCGAQIEVGFGSLPPNPGVITGVVTDAASGAPLAGMFVGTGFGGSATTAADGTYRIEGVPTSDNGTPIEWTVSVVPGTLDPHLPASLVVSVLPGATVDASFALELPAPPNEAPTALLTAPAPVAEGGSVTLDASGSSDPENAALAFAWDLDGDGVYADGVDPVVSLSLPVAGTRTVSVQVTDDAGATAVASVQVVAVNVDPVVDAGGDATLEPTGHLARTGSFADPGADTFTATVDFGEGDGSQQLALDGTSFVLDHNYPAGTYTVTVWVYDGHGGAGQDVFTVTVPQLPPPNKVPTAGDVSVETDSNTPVAVTLTGDDGDGDTLTYALVEAPAVGTLTGSAPALTYVPQAGFVGTVTFTYSVHDGKDVSPPATVTISVVAPPPPPPPPNTAPVAEDAVVSTAYETAIDVALVAADADGDTLTYAVVDWPAHGSLDGSGAARTYTPAAGFSGTDTFTFRASDGTDVSRLATVTITVAAAPPPPPPPAGVALLLSDNSARSANVRPLDGQVLRNGAAMYAFVGPQAQVPSIKKVTFFLDDPQRKSTPFSIEAELAFDFARTGANRNGCRTCADSPALPFESNLLTLGSHTITAYVEFKDGRTPVVLTSTFEVADTTPHAILVSTRSDRGNGVPLAGATLKDKRYIFLGAAQDAIAGAQYVRFVLDGNKVIDEALIPYDLKATASNGSANALDTRSLSKGTHTLEAIVQFPEGVTYRYSATFTVIR